jgi:hypothetical protein
MTHTNTPIRRGHLAVAIVLTAVAVLLVWPSTAGAGGGEDAPRLKDPNATASKLANRFLTLVEQKDLAGLRRFISPAYQTQRANGTSGTKADALKTIESGMTVVEQFTITDVVGTQDGPVLIARYQIAADEKIAGEEHAAAPSLRLSTFVWSHGRWRIAAHANFNVPA